MMYFKNVMIMICVLVSFTVKAQDDLPISNTKLEDMLIRLKSSADDLSLTNTKLNSENEQLRSDISRLQLNLGKLKAQEGVLAQSNLKLQNKDESKAKTIALIQKELFALDAKLEKAQLDLKEAQDQLLKINQDDQNLDEQLKQIQGVSINEFVDPVQDGKIIAKRKEKISLLKMITQSQDRQMQLQSQLLQLKPAGPASDTAQVMGQREALLAHIASSKSRLDSLTPIKPPSLQTPESQDIKNLSRVMASLEQNYNELRKLWEKMQEKAQTLRMNNDQKNEKIKIDTNISDLNIEASRLKAQLQALREQMVELDKRKTKLQNLLNK